MYVPMLAEKIVLKRYKTIGDISFQEKKWKKSKHFLI